MTVLHTGSTKAFSSSWERIFSGGKGGKKAKTKKAKVKTAGAKSKKKRAKR